MSEQNKIQIPAEVVAETSGLDRITQGMQEVARVGQQAGAQASAGIDKIGASANTAADKVEAANKKFEASIKKAMELNQALAAGPRGSSGFIEARAAQSGADVATLKPLLDQLRAMEDAQKKANAALGVGAATLNTLGTSAKATAFALRQVPAQFTDIVVSLQSGQAPLTVLLQQGGQLKDMFGGIGPAARALGGYIAGLVNPFTIAAAAVGGLAFAANEGSKELRAFQNAATLTGNAIGLSVSGFTQMRDSLAGIAGTKGKAAEVLTEIAKSGQIAAASVKSVAEAAILLEKATGQAVSKTIEQFAKLGDDPAKAAAELNKQYNFLTTGIYAQIKALEEQGDKLKAADLAERTYAEALKSRATGVVENVGIMERAWRSLAGAAKAGWDAMLNAGREKSLAERFAEVGGQVAKAQGPFDPSAFGGNAEARARLSANRDVMQSIFRQMEIEQRNTTAAQENAAATKAGIEAYDKAAKASEQYADKQTKLNKALKDYRDSIAELRKTPADQVTDAIRKQLDPKTIARTESGIREQFMDRAGESQVAGLEARKKTLAEELKRLENQLATGNFAEPAQLTQSEKERAKLLEELTKQLTAKERAEKQHAAAILLSLIPVEKAVEAQKKQNKAYQESLVTLEKQGEAVGKQADSIRQQAAAQEAANATFGKSKTAIEEMVLGQLKLQAAEADAFDNFDPKYVAALKEKVKAQADYVEQLQQTEFLQKSRSLDEATRVANEEAATLQLEVSLLGRTQQEREKIIAQRKVEVALAKELAEIDKLNIPDDRRAELKDKAQSKARIQSANAEQKTIVDEWQRSADSINQSLTDALLRGFESGKGFASNFRDTLKNMFSTLVLRPIIQAVMAPVSGTLAGIGQGIGNAITGGAGSAIGGAGGFLGSLGSGLGMFSQAAGATVSNGLIGGFGANMANIGELASGGELLGALGAAAPYLAIGALAVSLFSKKGGGPKTESGFGFDVPTRGDPTAAKAVADAITAQYKAIAGDLAKSLQVGVFSATDPQGTAKTQLQVVGAINGTRISDRLNRLGSTENVGRSDAELQAAITEESNRVVLKALEETHLPDKIGAYLKQLGDVDKLSGGALTDAVAKLQKAMTERTTLEAQLFGLTHTALEQAAEARRKEREAIDDTNIALYDHVAALTDLTAAQNTARDALLAAFQTQSDALKATIERNQSFAQQLRDLRDGFSAEGLTPAQRRAQAASKFGTTLTGAIAGNESALQQIGGVSKEFIDAVKASARTPAEVATAVAKVQAGLTTAAAAADGRVSTAQQQLDAMTAQLSALGLLNSSVLTVGDALAAYLDAQTAIQQEQLRYTASMAAQQQAEPLTVTIPPATTPEAALTLEQLIANWKAGLQAPAAGGGMRNAGSLLVGELGPEVVDFDTPGRVYTSEQTRGMFSSNVEQVPLLRQIIGRLDALRADGRAVDVESVAALKGIDARLKKFDRDGLPAERVIA